jgi:UDP-N-acetylmuramate dehydrogenase
MKNLREKIKNLQTDVSLKNYSTFRIGGPAKYFVKPETTEELISVLKIVKEDQIPFYIIGGGSKLLISDKGFDGLVIKTNNKNLEVKDNIISVDAGILTNHLIQKAKDKSLTGVEWLAGIPGMVGGSINGNAGAFGGSMEDIIESVQAFDLKTGEIIDFSKEDCQFKYRSSIFKKNSNLIILSADLKLKEGNKEEIKKEMEKYFNHRRKHHPLQYPSVGCIFTNPVVNGEEVPAWKVVVDCELIGKRIGNVKVSEKHSNFIVNLGEGKASEVEELINLIKKTAQEKFGISLTEEVQYL